MFQGIFRSNFRTKCKSLLRRIRTRLEMIKKRRNAMQRFLKKDIAELLKSKLDRNAYGRAEGLYMELILSSCYEFVEQCGTCVVQNLKEMHKQSECPEHCRVAVASLIYAAARFADLPELRDLRNHFIEKYGKTVESYVKNEFVEGLKRKPPTTEMKLKLMHEIAQEFSVVWDSSNLEQQLQSSTTSTQDPARNSSDSGANTGGRHLLRNKSCLGPEKGKQVDNNEDETGRPKSRRRNSCTEFKENSSNNLQDQNHLQEETCPENNSQRKPLTNKVVPTPNAISDIKTKEDINQNNENDDDDSPGKLKPRPKSVRTKFLKPSASTNQGIITSNNSEYALDLRENLSARITREKGNELLSDEEDDDKFENLSTYMGGNSSSKKEENGTPKFYLPPPPGKRRYLFSDSPPGSPVKDADNFQRKPSEKSRFFTPEEQKAEMVKAPIRHARSNSGHQVHPKLPDCDELAERIAVLKNA